MTVGETGMERALDGAADRAARSLVIATSALCFISVVVAYKSGSLQRYFWFVPEFPASPRDIAGMLGFVSDLPLTAAGLAVFLALGPKRAIPSEKERAIRRRSFSAFMAYVVFPTAIVGTGSVVVRTLETPTALTAGLLVADLSLVLLSYLARRIYVRA